VKVSARLRFPANYPFDLTAEPTAVFCPLLALINPQLGDKSEGMNIAVQMTAADRLDVSHDCRGSAIDNSRLVGRATIMAFVRSTGGAGQWQSD